MSKPTVVSPKSLTQQQQIGLVHQGLFELSLECVNVLRRILTDPNQDQDDIKWAVKMVLERTVAPVQRVQQTTVTVQADDEELDAAHERAVRVLNERLKGTGASDARIH